MPNSSAFCVQRSSLWAVMQMHNHALSFASLCLGRSTKSIVGSAIGSNIFMRLPQLSCSRSLGRLH